MGRSRSTAHRPFCGRALGCDAPLSLYRPAPSRWSRRPSGARFCPGRRAAPRRGVARRAAAAAALLLSAVGCIHSLQASGAGIGRLIGLGPLHLSRPPWAAPCWGAGIGRVRGRPRRLRFSRPPGAAPCGGVCIGRRRPCLLILSQPPGAAPCWDAGIRRNIWGGASSPRRPSSRLRLSRPPGAAPCGRAGIGVGRVRIGIAGIAGIAGAAAHGRPRKHVLKAGRPAQDVRQRRVKHGRLDGRGRRRPAAGL